MTIGLTEARDTGRDPLRRGASRGVVCKGGFRWWWLWRRILMVNAVHGGIVVRETTKRRMWRTGSAMSRGRKEQLGLVV